MSLLEKCCNYMCLLFLQTLMGKLAFRFRLPFVINTNYSSGPELHDLKLKKYLLNYRGFFTLCQNLDRLSLDRSTATWPVEVAQDETKGWRHFRIQQNGKNSSKQMAYLSMSGFELYGRITGLCDDKPGTNHRKQRKLLKAQVGLILMTWTGHLKYSN